MTLRGLYLYGTALTRPVTVLHAKPACTRPVGADSIRPQADGIELYVGW